MRRALPVVLLMLLLPFHILGLQAVTREWKSLPKGEDIAYVIPSPILKVTSLEFKGLTSDVMFLRALVFFGGLLERGNIQETKKWEWRWIHDTLNASTDLDPYFYDPYYFGEAQLTWGANMIKEANTLLDKGSKYRDWDWMLPFFIGFNHFYFLQENDKASEYLMTASKRPGGSSMFASLATRLAYKGQRTENAIVFVEEMLKEEKNESVRKEFETRLEALKGILLLERAVIVYKDRFGIAPFSLKDLITAGIIAKLPEDPYGGEFYIALDGSIKTTSDLRPMTSPATSP